MVERLSVLVKSIMNELVFFTNNSYKVKELNEICIHQSFKVRPYRDLIGKSIDVIEDGQSFSENAMKKLGALTELKGYYRLAEDSGLEVESLDGAPGIYSARYAGEDATGTDMCQKILAEMQHKTNRSAQYRAVFALMLPDDSTFTFEGVCKGAIAREIRGEGGFGYDPIFIPETFDQSFGELPITIKHQLSHRFKAFDKMMKCLTELAI